MDKATSLYLLRKVLRRDAEGQEFVYPLEQSQDLPAYVLLGEPGSGKTDSFEHEAQACGGHYIKARNFSLLKKEELAGRIVFIDGLDERRAVGGSGHTPLEHIREQLDRLGRPRFRLSCREADWLGDSDRNALAFIAPTGTIEVLHLEPLSDNDVVSLLEHVGVADPKEFFKKARQHRLDDALRNPNTLQLLAKAVGDGDWPKSKAEIFERACRVLARDISVEHQTAAPGPPPAIDKLLEAAGYLCAVLLLSGDEGITPFDLPGLDGIVPLAQLAASELPLVQALRTNLFRGSIDSGRTYLHRSVAEFLAAKYIAERIEEDGLPLQRILAACTGKDGGVAPDLRGLCAWLSTYSRTARLALIDRDPLGVVLYGDVSTFMPDDKRRVFAALRREAERYPAFRSSDWTTEPFGALSTEDMVETIWDLLRTPATTDGEQSFQDCVMDAVKHGEPIPSLEPLLERIARNANYWPSVRWTAMEAIEQVNRGNKNCLFQLLEDIRSGTIEDRDDELLGHLLNHLYARGAIDARRVLDYLHPPKQEDLIGRYRQFWSPELAQMASDADLPILLEELANWRISFEGMREHYVVRNLVGELLVRTLAVHGDRASDDEIHAWLTAGQDKWGNVRLEHDEEKQVSAWISARPERYKMLAARPIEDCRAAVDVAACLRHVRSRLFDAKAPADIVEWYLAKASHESQADIAEYYFHRAVIGLMRQDAPNWPSEASLDLLDLWVKKFPRFQGWREDATSYPLDHWERDESQRKKKRKAEDASRKKELRDHYRKHLSEIRGGTAPAHVMSELAQVHDGRIIEGRGDTPEERLDDFFEGDAALIEATLVGLPRVLERQDLPTVDEIISVDLDKKYHYIREAALVGMERRYKADRDGALALPKPTLEKLSAFWLVKGTSEECDWYEALAQAQPETVAAAVLPYTQRSIKAKKEHVTGIWHLGHSKEMAAVASLVLPTLLQAFPLRYQAKQLERYLDPMLRGALAYMPRSNLAAMVASKLDRATLDAPQRVYWLATGLLIDARRYQRPLIDFVKGSAARRGYLAYFLGERLPQSMPPIEELPDSALIALVELLGPEASPEFARGLRRRAGTTNLGQLVRILIQSLKKRGSDAALRALERMLDIPNLAPWGNLIRSTLNTIRVSQRKATIPQLTPRQASEIVSNQQPANAGDLAAIAVGHLRDIARKIRDGATNDYKQYWNLENNTPKVENLCRDALLSQLEERLGKHGDIGIPANKEAHVADEGRVDMMVSYGGSNGFSVPVEAKVESYRKGKETVWTALRTQLIDRYSRFPTAKGHGIYVVFWFGGKSLPPSPTGIRPKTPAELEAQLRATLAPEDSRIEIVVIDCSLPTKVSI